MQGAFTPIIPRLQSELNMVLSGPMAPMIRGYLPQVWVFETERGPLTLCADTTAAVTAFEGSMKERDVTIRIAFDALVAALQSSAGRHGAPGRGAQVTFHSQKGNVAFSYVREQLGL